MLQLLSRSGRRIVQYRSVPVRPLASFRPCYRRSISSMSNVPNGLDSQCQSFANFDLVKRIALDKTDIVVSKWQSRITGLTVVHLDYEGKHLQRSWCTPRSTPSQLPSSTDISWWRQRVCLIHCSNSLRFILSVFDDSGCPHTLEQ